MVPFLFESNIAVNKLGLFICVTATFLLTSHGSFVVRMQQFLLDFLFDTHAGLNVILLDFLFDTHVGLNVILLDVLFDTHVRKKFDGYIARDFVRLFV